MSSPIVLSTLLALACLGLLITLALHSRRRAAALAEQGAPSEVMGADRESFTDYYRPMTRILDPREFDHARSLSGVCASDFARFRKARLVSFRSYLNEIQFDFNRIEFKMRYLMLAASQEEAQMVVSLNQIKSSFQLQLLRVEAQLFLFRFGWAAVDIQPLVEMLEQMEGVLIRRPATSAASA